MLTRAKQDECEVFHQKRLLLLGIVDAIKPLGLKLLPIIHLQDH